MHKMVNGIKIEMTPEEEKELLEYQAQCKAEEDEQLKIRLYKTDLKKKVLEKIKSNLGLSDEETECLF